MLNKNKIDSKSTSKLTKAENKLSFQESLNEIEEEFYSNSKKSTMTNSSLTQRISRSKGKNKEYEKVKRNFNINKTKSKSKRKSSVTSTEKTNSFNWKLLSSQLNPTYLQK